MLYSLFTYSSAKEHHVIRIVNNALKSVIYSSCVYKYAIEKYNKNEKC